MSDVPPQMMAPQGMPMAVPPMVPNPAYAQWVQQALMPWMAEKKKREGQFTAACELIKSDAAKRFKIDIEADSTVAADEQAEKQARTEFLTAITPFLETVLPQMASNPALAPLGKELVLFAVRGFRVSRQLEDAFETALDKLEQMSSQAPPQPQGGKNTKSPMEIQAEAGIEHTKAQVQMAGVQQDAQEAAVKAQTAQQTNALKLAGLQLQEKTAADRLAQDQVQHEQSLALQAREMEGRERMDEARINRMAARNTQGLV